MIVSHTYPDIQHKYKDEEFLKSIANLASTNEVVDQINDYILNIIPGEEKEYFSCDSIDMTDVATTECYEAVVATCPSAGGRREGSRERLPWKEIARSRHQRLYY